MHRHGKPQVLIHPGSEKTMRQPGGGDHKRSVGEQADRGVVKSDFGTELGDWILAAKTAEKTGKCSS